MQPPVVPTPNLPSVDADPGSQAWVLGILVIAIMTLASVVGVLFKLYIGRNTEAEKLRKEVDDAHAKEREAWITKEAAWDSEREADRERERAHYEQKHRELVEKYDQRARTDIAEHFVREEAIRERNADLMEKMAAKAAESSSAQVALLQKMHDRFLSRKRGG